MQLDSLSVTAVGFVQCIGIAVGFTLALMVLGWRRQYLWWSAAFWCDAVAMVFLGLRDMMPAALSIIAGNAFSCAAWVLLFLGVCRHVNRRPPLWAPLLLAGGFMAGIIGYTVLKPDLLARLNIFAAVAAVWDLWVIVLLLRAAPENRASRLLAATLFGLDAVHFLVRLAVPIHLTADQNIMQTGPLLAASYLVGMLVGIGRCFAIMLLVLEQLIADLRLRARTDGLTGLLNRSALVADGERELQICSERQQPFALLIFDLDHFKRINDTCGHAGGDAVLRHFAALVREQIEGMPAQACRWGGEEFVIMLPSADLATAITTAESIRAAVWRSPAESAGRRIALTTSVGVAMADPGDSFDELLAQADAALYRAKHEGRNRISCAPLHAV